MSLDKLDRQIIEKLHQNAWVPFSSIASDLKVAAGTIQQRVKKLQTRGILLGSSISLNMQKVGLHTGAFIEFSINPPAQSSDGITANISSKPADATLKLLNRLWQFSEITEIVAISGSASHMMKIHTETPPTLHHFIEQKLRPCHGLKIEKITLILETLLQREASLPVPTPEELTQL